MPEWLSLEVLGACFLTASLFLGLYGLSSGLIWYDSTLNAFLFLTGILAILVFSMTRSPYENILMLTLLVIAGAVTFASSMVLIKYNSSLVNSTLSYSVNLAFLFGQFKSMKIVDSSKIVKRNIIYQTLMFIVRAMWAVI